MVGAITVKVTLVFMQYTHAVGAAELIAGTRAVELVRAPNTVIPAITDILLGDALPVSLALVPADRAVPGAAILVGLIASIWTVRDVVTSFLKWNTQLLVLTDEVLLLTFLHGLGNTSLPCDQLLALSTATKGISSLIHQANLCTGIGIVVAWVQGTVF